MMLSVRKIKIFTDRYPFVGPTFWILSVQYYIVQFLSAKAWLIPYSLASNTISDLGNTSCGVIYGRYICSPLHSLMNASFIMLGITMVIGSGLIYQEFRESRGTFLGFTFMGIAGIGTLMVGLYPENSISILHAIGAAMPFILGNMGIIILGFLLDISRLFRAYSLFSGLIALLALVFFETHLYFGIGIGGMERITAYPQTTWLIVFGIYMSKNHIVKNYRKYRLSAK